MALECNASQQHQMQRTPTITSHATLKHMIIVVIGNIIITVIIVISHVQWFFRSRKGTRKKVFGMTSMTGKLVFLRYSINTITSRCCCCCCCGKNSTLDNSNNQLYYMMIQCFNKHQKSNIEFSSFAFCCFFDVMHSVDTWGYLQQQSNSLPATCNMHASDVTATHYRIQKLKTISFFLLFFLMLLLFSNTSAQRNSKQKENANTQ